MSTPTPDYAPNIPPLVRTVVYVIGVATGFLTLLATGIVAVVAPGCTDQVAAIGAAATGAVGWLASVLGVAYRPTRTNG